MRYSIVPFFDEATGPTGKVAVFDNKAKKIVDGTESADRVQVQTECDRLNGAKPND